MAKSRPRSPAEKAEQKNRTSRNQEKRYLKLIEKNPENRDVKSWKKNVEFYSKQ